MPSPFFYEGVPPPTYFCFPTLAFPYTGALSLHWTKGLSSHWCPTRPSSATYTAGAMSPFHVYSLVGELVLESSRRVWLVDIVVLPMDCKPLQLFCPLSSSSIEHPMLNPMVGYKHLPLYLSGSG